jgi:hypothetical protein
MQFRTPLLVFHPSLCQAFDGVRVKEKNKCEFFLLQNSPPDTFSGSEKALLV